MAKAVKNSQQTPAKRKKRSPAAQSAQQPSAKLALAISLGADICHDLAAAEQREWLVTNGIGGFASGTVAGSSTRRYHGLLVAALKPPGGRTVLLAGLDETATVDGHSYPLATHRWLSGAVVPQGHLLLQGFRLDGTIPVWTYQLGPALLEKRVWMRCGENTTFVQYSVLQSPSPVDLELKTLVNYRDFHSATHAGNWHMNIAAEAHGIRVNAFDGAVPFFVRCIGAHCAPQHVWYRDFFYSRENERGLDDREDQLLAAVFRAQIGNGQSLTLVCSTAPDATLDGPAALAEEIARRQKVLASASDLLGNPSSEAQPAWLPQLILAADQFVVKRSLSGAPEGRSIIAGYHWFSDWGRDTMIALPGIALATGRADVARQILLAFAQFVDRGMLPNNFPDSGSAPEYNTVDATLWYFEAIRRYFAATNDLPTLKTLFPVLAEIVAAHERGTRYNIHVDPEDGLLYGGGPGVQLTWMDAKVGDWVVTPRTGKAVEINALWINALESMIQFAQHLNASPKPFQQLSVRAQTSFARFWNPRRNCCFDVLDSPGIGNDESLRPNQILAVSLCACSLSPEQQKAVVDTCTADLLTPFGLRSLATGERGYTPIYSGGPRQRDAGYHQGTVWGWLLGPFATAHYRVYNDRAAALGFLEPLAKCCDRYGLGTLAEIFDGDPPHQPRGCIAQAWTVGELLRAWKEISAES